MLTNAVIPLASTDLILIALLLRHNFVKTANLVAGEDSLSHHVDYHVGLSIIDRFTYYLLEFLQGIRPGSKATMQDLTDHIRYGHAWCRFLSGLHVIILWSI